MKLYFEQLWRKSQYFLLMIFASCLAMAEKFQQQRRVSVMQTENHTDTEKPPCHRWFACLFFKCTHACKRTAFSISLESCDFTDMGASQFCDCLSFQITKFVHIIMIASAICTQTQRNSSK